MMTTIVLRVSALTALLLALSARDTSASIFGRSPALSRSSQWGLLSEKRIQHFCSLDALTLLRGGEVDDNDDEEEDDEEEDEEEDDEGE
jgi:hypothetical protein